MEGGRGRGRERGREERGGEGERGRGERGGEGQHEHRYYKSPAVSPLLLHV